jgi:hypothetical protein
MALYYDLQRSLRTNLANPQLSVNQYLNVNFPQIPYPPCAQMRRFEQDVVLPFMRMLRATRFQVTDSSLLRSIEQNAIALLSIYTRGAMGIDPLSREWLGRCRTGLKSAGRVCGMTIL